MSRWNFKRRVATDSSCGSDGGIGRFPLSVVMICIQMKSRSSRNEPKHGKDVGKVRKKEQWFWSRRSVFIIYGGKKEGLPFQKNFVRSFCSRTTIHKHSPCLLLIYPKEERSASASSLTTNKKFCAEPIPHRADLSSSDLLSLTMRSSKMSLLEAKVDDLERRLCEKVEINR